MSDTVDMSVLWQNSNSRSCEVWNVFDGCELLAFICFGLVLDDDKLSVLDAVGFVLCLCVIWNK